MEFIEDQIVMKLLTACCADCGSGCEIQFSPSRDVGRYTGPMPLPTWQEAYKARQEWEQQHRKACKGPVRLLEAVSA